MCCETDQLIENLSKLRKELELRMIVPTQLYRPESGITNTNVSDPSILIIDHLNLIKS